VAIQEFSLISRYFAALGGTSDNLLLGVGDDCALFSLPPGCQLAVTTDSLVEGVHFPPECDPDSLAQRALRVNLSDLAAMGGSPLGFQLGLTLPAANEDWLTAFSRGLGRDALAFACPLSGGDTTRGPLTITITLLGAVPAGRALVRSGAGAGDLVYVTGTLGDSRGGLEVMRNGREDCQPLLERYWRPQPRLRAGQLLRDFASAAIDISDGLVQDVGHIASHSGLGCTIESERLPLSSPLINAFGRATASRWALGGGDDYELCFTVPPARTAAMEQALAAAGETVTRIGAMTSGSGVTCVDARGQPIIVEEAGYAHF